MLQSNTLPGVPMMMFSVILLPLATSSPLTAYLMVRSGQNWDILLATSPICKASSRVGDRHSTWGCCMLVLTQGSNDSGKREETENSTCKVSNEKNYWSAGRS